MQESPNRKSTIGRVLRRWLILLALVYLGICLVLSFLENQFIFRPCTAAEDWQEKPSAEIEDVYLTLANGTKIHGWFLPHPSSKGAVLYFHGNAGNLSHRGRSLLKNGDILGSAVFIIDYPGYGKSEGTPSEQSCYAAADAAYDWLTKTRGFASEDVLIYGGLWGGAVAVDLASRRPHRALVLAKTFTSAVDVGARRFPWLPVRWLMR